MALRRTRPVYQALFVGHAAQDDGLPFLRSDGIDGDLLNGSLGG